MLQKREIKVYAHWEFIQEPILMGVLISTPAKGKEIFSFEYSREWLKSDYIYMIDPDLQLYSGRFFPKEGKLNFGAFLDSSPDRWGRVLMDRREAVIARQEKRQPKKLLESDYLLGVFDGHRMGGLRFKWGDNENFQNDDSKMAAPPFTSLPELEVASRKFEEDNLSDTEYLKWINLLIAPGSSLGGARPKASVADSKGRLWIAKFPSINDDKNIGAWEMVANQLAIDAGINTAIGEIKQFNNRYHTFLSKRFDRNDKGERIHFASAMTLLGYYDGSGHETGVSYLELAEFIIRNGSNVTGDLEELWRRIVFFILIKNTDDHLRNHGFLLTRKGWALSPAYDINPVVHGTGLSLNISETDNTLDIELARSVAEYYRVDKKRSQEIILEVKKSVDNWRAVARNAGISKAEQDAMKRAFEE